MVDPATPTWLVDVLKHLVAEMPFVGLLGFLLWRSEKRVTLLMDMLLDLSRANVKASEQTIAAINTNTTATRAQAEETRMLSVKLDSLIQARRGRGG